MVLILPLLAAIHTQNNIAQTFFGLLKYHHKIKHEMFFLYGCGENERKFTINIKIHLYYNVMTTTNEKWPSYFIYTLYIPIYLSRYCVVKLLKCILEWINTTVFYYHLIINELTDFLKQFFGFEIKKSRKIQKPQYQNDPWI